MVITRQSPFSGKTNTMNIHHLTQEAYVLGMQKMNEGVLLQNAFSQLNADEREFIKTGIFPREWAEPFGGDE